MANLLKGNISKSDEIFLKEFSINFYRKIIGINDFNTFENTLSEWIKNINKNTKEILELMQKNKFCFSSIIGFFYQYGISCDVDKNKSLKFYLLAVNNGETSNKNFKNLHLLHLLEEDDEFDIMQNNIIVGKYLLSLFYYKDIILENKLNDFIIQHLKSSRRGDPIA